MRGSDEAAFRELADAFRGELQAHCYRIMGSVHDAEDLVQETLLAAWRGLDGFEGRAAIGLAFVAGLQRLAPRQRAVLVLRDVLGFRAAEVAETLGTTEGSVNSALHRARSALDAGLNVAPREQV